MTVYIEHVSEAYVATDDLEQHEFRVVILRHQTTEDREWLHDWLDQHGISGSLKFNDGNPRWYCTVFSDEELMKMRLAFFEEPLYITREVYG